MNSTYDDCHSGNCEMQSLDMQRFATTLRAAVPRDAMRNGRTAPRRRRVPPNHQMAGFFSQIAKGVKSSVVSPLKATAKLVTGKPKEALAVLKKDLKTQQEVTAKTAKITVPILSALSPFTFGITGAIAAGVGVATADYNKRQAKLQAAKGGAAPLMDEYKALAGTLPGRAIGIDLLTQIVDAAFKTGNKHKTGNSDARDFVTANGKYFKGKPPNPPQSIGGFAPQAIAAGAQTAAAIVDYWHSNDPKGGKFWAKYDTSPLMRQLNVDIADAFAAQVDPNFPISYAQIEPGAQAAPVIATPNVPAVVPTSSAPKIAPVVTVKTPAPTAPRTQVVRLAPAQQALPSAGVSPDLSNQLNAMIAALQAQGANQAQTLESTLAALRANGVTATPEVTKALTADIAASAGAPSAGMPPWLIPALIGAGVLGFVLLRKKGRR